MIKKQFYEQTENDKIHRECPVVHRFLDPLTHYDADATHNQIKSSPRKHVEVYASNDGKIYVPAFGYNNATTPPNHNRIKGISCFVPIDDQAAFEESHDFLRKLMIDANHTDPICRVLKKLPLHTVLYHDRVIGSPGLLKTNHLVLTPTTNNLVEYHELDGWARGIQPTSITEKWVHWIPCLRCNAEPEELPPPDFPDDQYLRNAFQSLQLVVGSNTYSMDVRFTARLYQHAFAPTADGEELEWESLESWKDLDLYYLLFTAIPLLEATLPPAFRFETQTMLANLAVWIDTAKDQDEGSETLQFQRVFDDEDEHCQNPGTLISQNSSRVKGLISSILPGHLVDCTSTQEEEKDFVKQYGKDISTIAAAASIDLITLSTFAMDSFTMEFEFSVGDRTIKFDPKFKDPSIETDTEVKCLQVEQCVAVVEEVEASLLIPLRLEVSEICSVEIPVTEEDKRRICSETSQCCGRKPSNGQRCENRRRGIHP
eukprot:gene37440-48974_t